LEEKFNKRPYADEENEQEYYINWLNSLGDSKAHDFASAIEIMNAQIYDHVKNIGIM